ncbi:uncharacterized protein isoform X1 [Musca autumnalis]|uniref:uncharacterized protein isoform X1 n=1 Tax=Musca autumnalis TaxID=221902 RepID=UPI003CF1BB2B
MSSTNFNDFASNCDVMIHIYKFLNVGDQLRLAQVNGKLRNLFLQYIWSISYNKLTIIEYEYLLYAASNCMDKDRILYLNSSDLEEFLTFYGNNVNGLYTNTRLRMEFFRNLIELKYCNKGVILNEMTQLSNTSPNLEVLQVYDHGLEFLPPNYFITRGTVTQLLRFVKLKKLVLYIIGFRCKIKFKDFWVIVTKLPLEILELYIPILFDSDDNEFEFQQSPLPLKQLEITTVGNDGRFFSMLNSFRNLKVLTTRLQYTNEVANALKCLTQLHQLTLNHSNFNEEANVILPPNITILHLKYCDGLLLVHLQQFLHEDSNPKLTEFIAIETDFRVKEFKELQISSRIKILNIEHFDLNQFRTPFVENSALENLTLHSAEGVGSGIHFVRLNTISFCRNLHTLDMHGQNLALDTLVNLKNLKKLSLDLISADQGFYIIRILLELPLLQELAVRELASLICPTLQAVVTSINCIKIFCFKPPGPTIGFWFDMFSLNPQLELQMRIAELDRETLQNLIQNEKFPSNLRKIKFFGLPVDCSELRNNCESVWKRLHYLIYDYEDHYTNGRKCNIIMSRNYNK